MVFHSIVVGLFYKMSLFIGLIICYYSGGSYAPKSDTIKQWARVIIIGLIGSAFVEFLDPWGGERYSTFAACLIVFFIGVFYCKGLPFAPPKKEYPGTVELLKQLAVTELHGINSKNIIKRVVDYVDTIDLDVTERKRKSDEFINIIDNIESALSHIEKASPTKDRESFFEATCGARFWCEELYSFVYSKPAK